MEWKDTMSILKICKHSNGYGWCFLHEGYCVESPCSKEELVSYYSFVCKPGDIIYRLDLDPEIKNHEIEAFIIDSIVIDSNNIYLCHDSCNGIICTMGNLINNTLYLDFYKVSMNRDDLVNCLTFNDGGDSNEIN